VSTLEEGVLRVLYEGPATVGECTAALLQLGHATEVVTDEIEALLADLVERACITSGAPRYTLTAWGSERLAALVEVD
jgi:hypothetical protein